jgi:hypothetical protein
LEKECATEKTPSTLRVLKQRIVFRQEHDDGRQTPVGWSLLIPIEETPNYHSTPAARQGE